MNTDTILERLLDRVDEIAESAAELKADMKSVKDHLAKLNGSVSRHEQALNESKLWQAAHEQKCSARISDATIIKSVAMICGTGLMIYGVKVTGMAEALVALLK